MSQWRNQSGESVCLCVLSYHFSHVRILSVTIPAMEGKTQAQMNLTLHGLSLQNACASFPQALMFGARSPKRYVLFHLPRAFFPAANFFCQAGKSCDINLVGARVYQL